MSYFDVAILASDADFANRCMACYASEPNSSEPATWWAAHVWQMAAQPGFGDAYASALIANVLNPGRDESVISDGQILAAVQHLNEGEQS